MNTSTNPSAFRDRTAVLLTSSKIFIILELLLILLLTFLPLRLTVIILFFVGWFSLWLRKVGWRQIGMALPANFGRTIITGIGAAILYQSFSLFLLVPFFQNITNEPLDLSAFAELQGNVGFLVVAFIIAWTQAAFIEEMVFRGYIFNRVADLFNKTNLGWGLGLITSSLLFGYVHLASQGNVGFLETAVTGLVAASLYFFSGRNLWLPIIFHGVVDTIGFSLVFLGLYP